MGGHTLTNKDVYGEEGRERLTGDLYADIEKGFRYERFDYYGPNSHIGELYEVQNDDILRNLYKGQVVLVFGDSKKSLCKITAMDYYTRDDVIPNLNFTKIANIFKTDMYKNLKEVTE